MKPCFYRFASGCQPRTCREQAALTTRVRTRQCTGAALGAYHFNTARWRGPGSRAGATLACGINQLLVDDGDLILNSLLPSTKHLLSLHPTHAPVTRRHRWQPTVSGRCPPHRRTSSWRATSTVWRRWQSQPCPSSTSWATWRSAPKESLSTSGRSDMSDMSDMKYPALRVFRIRFPLLKE